MTDQAPDAAPPVSTAEAGVEVALGRTTAPQGELSIIGVREGAFGNSDSGDTSGFGGLVEPIVMPGPTPRPYGGWFDEVTDELELALQDANLPIATAIEKVVVDRGEITFFVRREPVSYTHLTLPTIYSV